MAFIEVMQVKKSEGGTEPRKRFINVDHIIIVQPIPFEEDCCEMVIDIRNAVGTVSCSAKVITVQGCYDEIKTEIECVI